MYDITPIIESVAALIAALITAFVIPYIRSKTTAQQQAEINAWVKIAVSAAEQIYKGSGRGEEKKAYVIQWLREHGIRTLAATPHTENIYTDVDMTQSIAIVVGTEQTGLTELWMKHSDLPVRIPMLGKIDSLNVATATTILLYEAARQRGWK